MDDCTIFSVSQYKGQEDLGYLCIEAERVNLYHSGMARLDTWVLLSSGRGLRVGARAGGLGARTPGCLQLCEGMEGWG